MDKEVDDIEAGMKHKTIEQPRRRESGSADELDVDFDEIFTNKLKLKWSTAYKELCQNI